jgi:hypothetical protein
MRTFFPYFFNSLSINDIKTLTQNEEWIVEVFGGFWKLVMEKFEKFHVGESKPPLDIQNPSRFSSK